MSLSGNLGFVSLDEILRLLTRSGQKGAVDVRGEQIRGRVFITKGGVGLATTSDDEGLQRHLVKSGLVDSDDLATISSGEGSLSPLVEKNGGALVELLREMTVESIYQMGLHGDQFEVYEGASSSYVAPKPFELEGLLADSKQRLTDWAEVSKVVDDLQAAIGFIRDLGDREEVKIDRESWMVLSEVGSGASVAEIADELGTTEFWTARIASHLINKDLVSIAHVEDTVETEAVVEEPARADDDLVEPSDEWHFADEPEAEHDAEPDDVDPNESWWQEPEAEEADEAAAEEAEEAMPVAGAEDTHTQEDDDTEEIDQMPSVAADESDEVEEDTEAFLEKVFSELETPEEPEEEGYGLLRRRRMGAIRDVSNDA